MPTIILVRGIQASGKSEFAKTWAATDPENRVRVNRDDIRRMITGTPQTLLTHDLESFVTRIEKSIALTALRSGKSVVIDAMNLRSRYVRAWLSLGYPVEFVDFPVSLDLALARNEARGGKVPEDVIRTTYERLTVKGKLPEPPTADELPAPVAPYVADETKPTAIIVDIDGTLAHMGDRRGPYDWDKVGLDELDAPVAALIMQMARVHRIILMSGREDVCRFETEHWVRENEVPYDRLYMRAAGDRRPDTVVKAELFDRHVRDHFNVLFAVDDRNAVVAGWRAMGIKTLQAQEGAF
ncbi:AAA family ATPase [Microbacterium sp. CFBP9023]|uniref:phosphatase domain-containing protein n=1 Tax=Microbacterium sp. CFBP9023 TaxID=3096535 RepID=UPI002A6B7F88|nr:AAA family ATPase [Microbacterium sp. CFBP9023]MDY0984629.1 AAA family ATPase [Microbacterium sp. CFBP9023]